MKKGVPGANADGRSAGDISTWIPRAKKWLETDYHTPATCEPDWDWDRPETLAKVGLIIGLRVPTQHDAGLAPTIAFQQAAQIKLVCRRKFIVLAVAAFEVVVAQTR